MTYIHFLVGMCFFLLSLNGFLSSSLATGFCPNLCDCQHSQHLMCTNRGLRTVPKPTAQMPEEVQIFSLGGNFISNISAFDFTRYSNLERLNLQYNQIRVIHPKAFENLPKLEELYLGHNLLTAIPAGSLQPLKKLTILYGNNNAIKKITPGLFSNLDNLIKLRLDGNSLEVLQDSVFKSLINLHYLHLESNKLQHIHRNAFSKLTSLRFLNLAHNKQSAMRNVLTFSHLKALTTLLLSENEIRHIGNHVFQNLKKLSKLSLSNNKISQMDSGALRGLSSLTELLIDGNELVGIPAVLLDPLERVEELDFSRNRISSVDSLAFSRLKHLRVLKLKDNFLTSLSGDMFTLNSVLYDLDLQGNNWTCDCRLEQLREWIAAAHSQGKLLTVFVQCHYPATLRGKYLDYVNSSQLQPLGNWTHLWEVEETGRLRPVNRGGVMLRPAAEAAGKRVKGRTRSKVIFKPSPSATISQASIGLTTTVSVHSGEQLDLLRSDQDDTLPVITDPCVFNRHFITNVSVHHVTSNTVTVYWTTRDHHRYTPGPGPGLDEVHYRVLFDRFGTQDRFPRYVYAHGAARSVTLQELSSDVTYMVCVEGVVGGSVCQVAPRDHCTGLVTLSEANGRGATLTSDLQLVTVAMLAGNAVLLLVIGGVWLGRSLRRKLQRRKSAVHVRHMYSTRRPFRTAMATASVSTDFTSYQSSRPARLAPLEEGDLIEFPCDRFLDSSSVRRESEMQRFSD
uniref:TLR4 interactor with leucine rich repeats n=1 Tax=Maylandia zebra TaxID=106582 RepID=A0A3P9BV29_9CICH